MARPIRKMEIRYPVLQLSERVMKPVPGWRFPPGLLEGEIVFELHEGQRMRTAGYFDTENRRLTERWRFVTIQHIDQSGVTVALEPMMLPRFLPWVVQRRYHKTNYRRESFGGNPEMWTSWDEGERVLCFEPLPELSGIRPLSEMIKIGELPVDCYEGKDGLYSETVYNANLPYFYLASAGGNR